MLKNKYIKRFNHVPIGCTGVGLGMGGLGALWTAILHEANPNYHNDAVLSIIQFFCIAMTIMFLCLVLLRNANHKGTFSNEIKHPLLSSFVPTMFMSTMLIGGCFGYIGSLTHNELTCNILTGIGSVIWYIAVLGHLIVFSLFVYHVVFKHNVKCDSLYASWFVPPVGIIVSCTVASFLSKSSIIFIPNQLFQTIWYFGFVMYMITLPIISYKLLFHRKDEKHTMPSIMIYGAPANLSLAGFIDVFVNANRHPTYYNQTFINVFVIVLTFLGILTTLVVYVVLPKILSVPFNPTYACLTFPLAIGATGTYKSAMYMHHLIQIGSTSGDLMNSLYWTVRIISYIELAITTIVIAYVFIRYLILLVDKLIIQAHKTSEDIFEYQDDNKDKPKAKTWISRGKLQ